MSVTANLTTNVETITATIVVEDETIIVQVSAAARGPAGEAGAAGATGPAGPNTLTTATTTNLTGFISGNGTNIAGATAAASAATPSTLVLRDANGGASFGAVNVTALTASGITTDGQIEFNGADAGDSLTFNTVNYFYGAGAASAHRTALGLGTGDSPTFAGATFAGLIEQRNGNEAQTLRIYRTFTDENNFRRLSFTSVANEQRILAQAGGTGAAMSLNLGSGNAPQWQISTSGHLLGYGDNNFDIGSVSANRPRDLHLARNAAIAGTLSVTGASTFGDLIEQRNGLNQQESRIYGTYTGPGNYRRLALKMDTAGVAQIVAEGGGSGALGNRIEIDGLRIGKGGGDVATNTALGASALNANTTGASNSAVGYFALNSNTTGQSNSAVGVSALGFNTSGSTNTAVGRNAGRVIADGTTANAITANSVYLGADTKALASNQTNQIVIGHSATGLGSNTAVLGNDSIITTALKGNVGIGTTSPTALLDVNSDTVRVRTARTPASAAAAGNAGDICWDADYIYVCTATDTWKRTAISTWP